MEVAVYDTYVPKKDGSVMHFDILVSDETASKELVYQFGRQYLAQKGQQGQPLTAKECRFCHIAESAQEIVDVISAQGYYIIEMQGCQ
ncbi:DUF2024 family protein [Hymenobacter sp. GOD-10R]|uniref:DUF2024 family protein n=1 Tax=Hymenobacter sp. GOD-10R TaxID=3093922 RepID=UPI002D79E41B|nr:DUF2024 family protein [Hymenobacter sp. GOD-10R]WRQ31257.1 DUF2024 family protein [Hymenobacter sp. GOD-10R]